MANWTNGKNNKVEHNFTKIMLKKSVMFENMWSFLKNVKKIFNFDKCILDEICTMNCVFGFIFAKKCSDRFRSKGASHFRIIRTTQLTKRCDSIILPNLHSNTASIRQFIHNLIKFGQNSFVDLKKLLSPCPI